MTTREQPDRVWTEGSYEHVGPNFLTMAAELVDAVDVGPDDGVLDVCCGTGNVAITAARRGADVTGVDFTPKMLDDALSNAAIAGVDVSWKAGDTTVLPFDDDAFDVTLSCVGHMFATPQADAAAELCRVTRPGGRIGFTAWTPSSVVPTISAVMAKYVPDEGDEASPFAWGDPDVVQDLLGDEVVDRSFALGEVHHLTMSPGHFWHGAKAHAGMFVVALERVPQNERAALRSEMIAAIEPFFDDRRNAVTMEYGLTTATVA